MWLLPLLTVKTRHIPFHIMRFAPLPFQPEMAFLDEFLKAELHSAWLIGWPKHLLSICTKLSEEITGAMRKMRLSKMNN